MTELLLEIFCEEIPSGLQARGAQDLQRLVCDGLKAAGIEFGDVKNFAGARRLTLVIDGLPEKSPDVSDERKGPRVGSPDKAIEGFLRGAGLSSVDEAEIVTDEKKGDFYVARIEKQGRATSDVIAELVPALIRQFPWPKSQRWGAGKLRWVRPLHSIICLLGGSVVPFDVDGISSGNETLGHRFMSSGKLTVSDFADYEKKLRDAHVILEAETRQNLILEGARAAAKNASLELVEDDALLAEAAGLVEWPVVLMGAFDEAFLDVPPEVIITAIKKHQKCFSLRDGKSGKLANKFILVSNLIAEDGGKAIIDGNERVVRARLSDAKFFWDQDRKIKLEDRLSELENVIFHEKLGTQAERVERLMDYASGLANEVKSDEEKTKIATRLCKVDLVTDMVGEFPDLQGLMGKYYALDQGEDISVASAIEEHYQPRGPNDVVPTAPISITVALADKLHTLISFWAIDEKPTGSKDPYALRRAALGVIRLLLENQISFALKPRWNSWVSSALAYEVGRIKTNREKADFIKRFSRITNLNFETNDLVDNPNRISELFDQSIVPEKFGPIREATSVDLLSFFHDRLKVYLRDRGERHDLIDAVISPDADNLLMIVARVDALGKFLDTDDGANLLAGVKRASNILRIEERKSDLVFKGKVETDKFQQDEEKALGIAITEATEAAQSAVENENFEGAMSAIAKLRVPVDAFFDNVTVNADDPALRENRLKLLNQIREATLAVADFSKIEG